ncbi:MAG: hypothetical protein ACO1Q7_13385, partial [Gemmatimonas sp.]
MITESVRRRVIISPHLKPCVGKRSDAKGPFGYLASSPQAASLAIRLRRRLFGYSACSVLFGYSASVAVGSFGYSAARIQPASQPAS